IRGTLRIPKLTLEAENQDYSQAELISYLISGKPSFELGGGEGAFVRSAAASLLAGELERTVVSDLGVPLDYLEIRPGDPTNPFAGAQFAPGWSVSTCSGNGGIDDASAADHQSGRGACPRSCGDDDQRRTARRRLELGRLCDHRPRRCAPHRGASAERRLRRTGQPWRRWYGDASRGRSRGHRDR